MYGAALIGMHNFLLQFFIKHIKFSKHYESFSYIKMRAILKYNYSKIAAQLKYIFTI